MCICISILIAREYPVPCVATQYANSVCSGTSDTCVTNHIADAWEPLAQWLRCNGRQALNTETGGGNTASCEEYMCQQIQYLAQNSDGATSVSLTGPRRLMHFLMCTQCFWDILAGQRAALRRPMCSARRRQRMVGVGSTSYSSRPVWHPLSTIMLLWAETKVKWGMQPRRLRGCCLCDLG